MLMVVLTILFIYADSEGEFSPMIIEQADANSVEESNSEGESLGWFPNVPFTKWERMKELHFINTGGQQHFSWSFPLYPGGYINFAWNPSFVCPVPAIRLGSGDGGKIICDPDRLKAEDCLVYSIGSAANYKFEQSVHQWNPKCEIHTFDHTYDGAKSPKFVTHHIIGLAGPNNTDSNLQTLDRIVQDLGHLNRKITLLKVDCDGCEFDIYDNFYRDNILLEQIVMEVHFNKTVDQKRQEDLMINMRAHGWVIVHKEVNTAYWLNPDCCTATEFTMLRFDQEVFDH